MESTDTTRAPAAVARSLRSGGARPIESRTATELEAYKQGYEVGMKAGVALVIAQGRPQLKRTCKEKNKARQQQQRKKEKIAPKKKAKDEASNKERSDDAEDSSESASSGPEDRKRRHHRHQHRHQRDAGESEESEESAAEHKARKHRTERGDARETHATEERVRYVPVAVLPPAPRIVDYPGMAQEYRPYDPSFGEYARYPPSPARRRDDSGYDRMPPVYRAPPSRYYG